MIHSYFTIRLRTNISHAEKEITKDHAEEDEAEADTEEDAETSTIEGQGRLAISVQEPGMKSL